MNMTLRIDPSLRRAVLAPTSIFAMGDEVSDLVLEFSHAAPDPDGLSLSLRRDGPSGDVVAIATAFSAVGSHRRLLSASVSLKTTVLDAWRLEVKAAADEAAASTAANPKKAPSPLQTAWLDVSSPSEVYASCPVPILLREVFNPEELLVGAVRYDKTQSLADREKATARANIGAGEPYDPAPLETRVEALEAKSEQDSSFGAWKSGSSVALGAGAVAQGDGTLALHASGLDKVYLNAASAPMKLSDAVASAADAVASSKGYATVQAATSLASSAAGSALETAKAHSDANLETAKSHSDANLDTAKAHSDANLVTAKSYADSKVSGALASKADLVDGKVPANQLPSYVDDVLEYDAVSAFPATGEDGKIYVAKDTNKTYRWGGTQYVEISPSLALGETAETAYPGDKGKAATEKANAAYSAAESLTDGVNSLAGTIGTHIRDTNNPHAVTSAQVGALPLVDDVNGKKTAVTIGIRLGTVGPYSLANGKNVTASGEGSHAGGLETVASGLYSKADGMFTEALGPGSYALGYMSKTLPSHRHAFVWNGYGAATEKYPSNGEGTFNINPVGGTDGVYIGEKKLSEVISDGIADKADKATTLSGYGITDAATTASLAPEYSSSSAYSVGSFVYHDGNIYQCTTAIADGGEAWNAAHWELRKLDDFFTNSNSLLTGTIDARLPYPLYAVPSTGLLKDRALNTTSLATVTVPDNFTDLIIRATVASSLSVTMPEAIATKYGDTFPGEGGEYLITITKTGAAEAYVRTIKLEVANA